MVKCKSEVEGTGSTVLGVVLPLYPVGLTVGAVGEVSKCT